VAFLCQARPVCCGWAPCGGDCSSTDGFWDSNDISLPGIALVESAVEDNSLVVQHLTAKSAKVGVVLKMIAGWKRADCDTAVLLLPVGPSLRPPLRAHLRQRHYLPLNCWTCSNATKLTACYLVFSLSRFLSSGRRLCRTRTAWSCLAVGSRLAFLP
jgi:hypothetical protein